MVLAGRPLSLSYYTVPELSFLEMVDVAAAAGFQYVGVRLLHGSPRDAPLPLLQSQDQRREAARKMAACSIRALDASAARIRPDTDPEDFNPLLDACTDLGIEHVMCSIDDQDRTRASFNLWRLCELAKPLGLRIEVEFVPWMSIASLNDAAQIVDECRQPNLGIAVDALHFDRSHSTLSELRSLPSDYFRLAQICDAPAFTDSTMQDQLRVATQERLFPGQGVLDLVSLITSLPDGIPLALEVPTVTLSKTMGARERTLAAISAARTVLRRVAERRAAGSF